MTQISDAKKKFKYRISNWMEKKELAEIEQTLRKGGCFEFIDYVYKKKGNTTDEAIFTKGMEIIPPLTNASSSEI